MLALSDDPPAVRLMPDPPPLQHPPQRHKRDLIGDEVKFVIRLQEGLRLQVSQLARLHHRSMNSEFVMGMEWWADRQTLMWFMLQATERELLRLEQLRSREEQKALDAIAQRLPQTAALVAQLKAAIEQA